MCLLKHARGERSTTKAGNGATGRAEGDGDSGRVFCFARCKRSPKKKARGGVGRRKWRREEPRGERAGLSESPLAPGPVNHFISSRAVARPHMREREEEEREVPSGGSRTLFTQKKKTEVGLKLKQGNTRKRSAVSCSPPFLQFPV